MLSGISRNLSIDFERILPIARTRYRLGEARLYSRNFLALACGFRYPRLRQEGQHGQRVSTVAFEGIEARAVDVKVAGFAGPADFPCGGACREGRLRSARAGALGADRVRARRCPRGI
jgi:hypothetical protein